MPAVMGIDASLTGTGVVVLEERGIRHQGRIQSKKKGVERLVEIENELAKAIVYYFPDLVCIEGYAFSRPNQAHQIGELGGVIRRLLHYDMKSRWIVIAPTQVKKFATGKGTCQKDLVLMEVYKRWGIEFQNSDVADAFVLAKIGTILLGNPEKLNVKQQEVIAQLQGQLVKGGE